MKSENNTSLPPKTINNEKGTAYKKKPVFSGITFIFLLSKNSLGVVRLSRYCIFFFCLTIAACHLIHFITLPLLEFIVVTATGLAAITFFFLSFRVLLPKVLNDEAHNELTQPETVISQRTNTPSSLEDVLRKHGLTERETEVAALILREGLDNEEIGKRIFRATVTVKNHITSIYRKFGVKTRSEFMAQFVKREQIAS